MFMFKRKDCMCQDLPSLSRQENQNYWKRDEAPCLLLIIIAAIHPGCHSVLTYLCPGTCTCTGMPESEIYVCIYIYMRLQNDEYDACCCMLQPKPLMSRLAPCPFCLGPVIPWKPSWGHSVSSPWLDLGNSHHFGSAKLAYNL